MIDLEYEYIPWIVLFLSGVLLILIAWCFCRKLVLDRDEDNEKMKKVYDQLIEEDQVNLEINGKYMNEYVHDFTGQVGDVDPSIDHSMAEGKPLSAKEIIEKYNFYEHLVGAKVCITGNQEYNSSHFDFGVGVIESVRELSNTEKSVLPTKGLFIFKITSKDEYFGEYLIEEFKVISLKSL